MRGVRIMSVAPNIPGPSASRRRHGGLAGDKRRTRTSKGWGVPGSLLVSYGASLAHSAELNQPGLSGCPRATAREGAVMKENDWLALTPLEMLTYLTENTEAARLRYPISARKLRLL